MDAACDRLMLSIPSNPRYLCVVRGFFDSLLGDLGFSSRDVMRVSLAIHEACANVIAHGYQGDTGQRIDLVVCIAPEDITVEIQDYGVKPDVTAIRSRTLQDIRPGGLGTYFMRAIMDEVVYDLSSDTGTLLRMTKRRSTPCTLT
jgi:anti-sigma regulatory factor (Ser/Thr protein kinase)